MISASELLSDLRKIQSGWRPSGLPGIWLQELSESDWEKGSIALHEKLAAQNQAMFPDSTGEPENPITSISLIRS